MSVDRRILADLVTFARIEQESHDLEPWAELINALDLPRERKLWVLWLYNAYDNFGSAWSAYQRWPSPQAWAEENTVRQGYAATLQIERERRNLFGGRMLKRYQSYVDELAGDSQVAWLSGAVSGRRYDTPGERAKNWDQMLAQTRRVWGVGRQASFEWTEFLAKCDPFFGERMDAGDACLWESSGPRKCLERIYGNSVPTREWLEWKARECRRHLFDQGVALKWVDFETVICDFNVMRDGRYYPGRHLAALAEEVAGVPTLQAAYKQIIPEPWRSGIKPGIDKSLCAVYAQTGRIVTP
jgi:Alpha-glutamyl/putrescinyl thymine pyrophosphorylase clade 2